MPRAVRRDLELDRGDRGARAARHLRRVFDRYAALTGAVLEIGADAVMFSVDYPYKSSHEAVAGLERTTLSDADRDKIAHRNAERILQL